MGNPTIIKTDCGCEVEVSKRLAFPNDQKEYTSGKIISRCADHKLHCNQDEIRKEAFRKFEALNKTKTGFWIRMWMGSGRGSDEESYEYLTYESGYIETDEASLKSRVEDWCNNEHHGWAREHYRYGYEIVAKPPILWIETRINELVSQQKEMTNEKELLEVILHEDK